MSNSSDNDSVSCLVEDTLEESSAQDDSLFYNSLESSDNENEEREAFFDYDATDSQRKQPYEVDYKVHSPEDLQRSEQEDIGQVRSVLDLSDQEAATLLRYFQWNKEKLFERYTENPAEVKQAAGIANDKSCRQQSSATIVPAKRAKSDFVCEICYDDDPDMETAALSCGHRFCTSCYTHYLTTKIQYEGESRLIQCPAAQCKMLVHKKMVSNLVDKSSKAKYLRLLGRTFVDDNESLRWCPAPDCEYAVECHIPTTSLLSIIPIVECNCGYRFCFGCGLADHQPCACALVKLWLQKCRDDSETANWISAHTKDCPKCQSAIEKNGGCNHMTCRNCRYEFCWVCMGAWSEHRSSYYACNRYAESNVSNNKNQAMSRASLERYLHYYNRYANHEQSAKLDRELYEKTEKKMQEMQITSDLSWIEVQFLKKAVDITVQCRMTLKWTYAFAFYLKNTHETEIFEDNQSDLELATEQLSELLEAPFDRENIGNLRQAILDKSVYVKQRRNILLDDALGGLQEGKWNFTVNLD